MSTRTRNEGAITMTPINTYTSTRNCAGVVTITDNYSTNLAIGATTTTVDVVTPTFNAKRKNGVVINNPFYSLRMEEMGKVEGEDIATKTGTCYTASQYKYGPWAVRASADYTTDEYQAAVTAAARIAGTAAMAGIEEPEVQGLVELAELGKTARMIKGTVPDFINLLRRVRKTRKFRKSGMHIAEYIVRSYLGVRYGFTPLASTLEALADSVSKSGVKPRRLTSRGSSSTGIYESPVTETTSVGTFFTTHATEFQSTRAEIRAGVLYEHKLKFDQYGLGVLSVPSAAWELMPWSFVVDWIWNVGDFIGAVTPKAGVTVLAKWTTIRSFKVGVKEYYTSANSVSGWSISCSRKGSHTARRTVIDRRPLVYVGISSKFHEINFVKPKDFFHLADALALTATLLAHPKSQSPKFRAANPKYGKTEQASRAREECSETRWRDLMDLSKKVVL